MFEPYFFSKSTLKHPAKNGIDKAIAKNTNKNFFFIKLLSRYFTFDFDLICQFGICKKCQKTKYAKFLEKFSLYIYNVI